MTDFQAVKSPGFCESYVWNNGHEYINSLSSLFACVWAPYTLYRLPLRVHAHDVILCFIFLNGVASCTFHWGLNQIAGSFDTFTMTTAMVWGCMTVLEHLQPPPWVYVPTLTSLCTVYAFMIEFVPLPGSGLDFSIGFACLGAFLIFLLFYQPRHRSHACVISFLGFALARQIGESLCQEAHLSLFWLHSVWHVGASWSACELVLEQNKRLLR